VQFLASFGDEILDELPDRLPKSLGSARALARLLAQIGTPGAVRKAQMFLGERRPDVIFELLDLLEPLKFSYIRTKLMSGGPLEPFLAKRISRFTSVAYLKDAPILDFSGFSLRDYTPLGELVNLHRLTLQEGRALDLGCLSSLKDLSYLNLKGSVITDISFVSGMISLETLDISHTPIVNIQILQDLPRLRYLNIYSTDIHKLPRDVVDRVEKVYTHSIELRSTLPGEKLMALQQASRVFG